MHLNIYFITGKERLAFLKANFHIDDKPVERNLLTFEGIPGLKSAQLSSSHQGIPGKWLTLTFHDDSTGEQLLEEIKGRVDPKQLEEHVFFPRKALSKKVLEQGWIEKYHLEEKVSEEVWKSFFDELKVHIKGKRYDNAFYGLLLILQQNPFFLKRYKRYYQFEELAYHYEEMGNINKAIRCLKAHLMLQPNSVEPYLNMSSFYIMNEMEEEAISLCKEALKKNPDNPFLISNLILALNNLGSYEYAVEYMKSVLKSQPESAYFWKLMGDVLYEVERSSEAIECYHRALESMGDKMDEDFVVDLYNGIAAASYEIEHYREAAEYYQKVLAYCPSDPYVLLSLSQIYFYKLDNVKEALKYSKLLLEKAPENGYGHYQLGLVYIKLEHFEKAKWHLYRAKKIMPYYEPVLEAIHYLKQADKIIKLHEAYQGNKPQ